MKSCQKKLPAVSHLHPAPFLKHDQLSEILHFFKQKSCYIWDYCIASSQSASRLVEVELHQRRCLLKGSSRAFVWRKSP